MSALDEHDAAWLQSRGWEESGGLWYFGPSRDLHGNRTGGHDFDSAVCRQKAADLPNADEKRFWDDAFHSAGRTRMGRQDAPDCGAYADEALDERRKRFR